MNFTRQYLAEVGQILLQLDADVIERVVPLLAETRARGGRLFILGVGGSAANASHAVNDFRKLAHLEAYAPTDNVSELTARTNDEGWASVFEGWPRVSRVGTISCLCSRWEGAMRRKTSVPTSWLPCTQSTSARESSESSGRDGGYTAQVADTRVIVPTVNSAHVTPHTEAF